MKQFTRWLFIFISIFVIVSSSNTAYSREEKHPQHTQPYTQYVISDSANFVIPQTLGLEKLDSNLATLWVEYEAYLTKVKTDGLTAPFQSENALVDVVKQAGIDYVVIDTAGSDVVTLQQELESLGMINTAVYPPIVSGLLPLTAIADANKLHSLQLARIAAYTTSSTGSVTSQGDAAQFSDDARALFGLDGSGIMVGTLSDSFDCATAPTTDYADDITSGDLPAGITILDDTSCPGIDEGRAMMQLIADVAPGADQAFHSAFGGIANFATGITDLATAGADVIVDDVLYFAEPMFQDGAIAQSADSVVAMGIPYFSSAGNSGRSSYESSFTSSGVPISTFGDGHDFDPGAGVDVAQSVTLPVGATYTFVLQWDEPFFSVSGAPGTTNDVNIFLASGFTLIAGSATVNIGGDAVEVMQFTNTGPATSFDVLITHASGAAPSFMKYVILSSSVTINEFNTASSTSYGHANAAGAEAVGAAAYFNTPDFGVSPPVINTFSSAGGTPILFDISGSPIVENRNKPEITAPDGGNTTFFGSDVEPDGFPNFFGTSAAAPHAAAVAALMLEANGVLTPTAVYTSLESTTIDMDDPATVGFDVGFDFGTGLGFIQAPDAICAGILFTNPDLTPTLSATTSGMTDVALNWVGNVAHTGSYNVHASNTPYFTPTVSTITATVPSGTTNYTVTNATGNAITPQFFLVQSSNCDNSTTTSAYTGEFGFAIEPGT